MNGLRRIAWGGTLILLSPLFFLLAPLPLGAGLVLAGLGARRASGQVEAFRVAAVAAFAVLPLATLFFLFVVEDWWRGATNVLFVATALALATLCAAVGEGHARLDGRVRSRLSHAVGWTTALGLLLMAAVVLADDAGALDDAYEDLGYGVAMFLSLAGWSVSVVLWHACARPLKVQADGSADAADPAGSSGPLPALPSWDD